MPLAHVATMPPAQPVPRQLPLWVPLSLECCRGGSEPRIFPDAGHPHPRKKPPHAITSHNSWLPLDFVFCMLASPSPFSQNFSPNFSYVLGCPSHVTPNSHPEDTPPILTSGNVSLSHVKLKAALAASQSSPHVAAGRREFSLIHLMN